MKKIRLLSLVVFLFCLNFGAFGQLTPPFTETFSSYLPTNWTEGTGTSSPSGSSSGWQADGFANSGSSGAAKFNLYSTGGDDWLVTPTIDMTGGGFEINLDVACTNYNSTSGGDIGSDDAVYLMQSVDGGTTWTTLYTWNNSNVPSNSGDNITVSVASVTSSTTKFALFALEGSSSGGDYDFFVDNFTVQAQPACPAPSSLTASSITATQAALSWTENGSATTYDIELGANGFSTTGTPTQSGVAKPYTYTGLSASTTYDYYVRADCSGSGNGSSTWAGPYTFTTPCASVTSFNENFDAVTTPSLPSCWASILENTSGTAHIQTSTSADNSPSYGVSMRAYYESSTDNIILVSPIVSNLSAGTHRLRFYAKNTSSGEDLEVGTITDPTDGSTFTKLSDVDINTTFAEYTVDFSSYSGSDNYVAIRRVISSYGSNYVYLDDIIWEAIPTGPPSCSVISSPADAATDIAVTTNLSWSANVDATGYKLSIGTTSGGTDILNNSDLGNVTSYNPTSDLTYNTTYYVTLIAYNANGDATSCSETTFTAEDGCISASSPSNSATGVAIAPTVSWSGYSVSGETGYIISVGTTAGGTDVVNAHDNGMTTTYALSGLSYSTTYYITIKAKNASGTTSASCTSTSFTTMTDPTLTPPFIEDFTSGYKPTNWSETQGTLAAPSTLSGTTSGWTNDGFGNVGSTGAARMEIWSTGKDEWLITPPIDLGNGSTAYQLEFDLALTYYSGTSSGTLGSDDKFVVVISTDNGTTWTSANVLQEWTNSDAISTTGDHITISLSSYTGSVKLGFYAESTVSNADNNVYIDNVEVKAQPSCPAPSALTASSITATQAALSWTENGSATTYDIELGANGFSTTGTPTQSGVAKPYTYTGLSATTTYDYYVRADCSGSGNGSSTWAGPYSFTTPVACPAPTSLSSSSVTTTTATITWTKGDAETSWEIAVQADGTGTPSSGTVVNTTATYNATSLSSNTAYEVYVRATCGGANGNSTWVGPHDFTTLCATQTPTYTQSFATWLDNCWEEGTGAISGPTSTGSSNWQADGFANSGSSGSAKTNFYSTGDKEWLLTPIFDLTGGGFEITVDVALTDFNSTSRSDNFATDDAVHLMQSIDGGSTWTTAHTWNNANSNLPSTSGDNVIINISSVTSATTQFAIFAIETTGSTGNRDMDFFVDNFTVQAQPACPQPSSLTATNITSSAADLGWTNGGGANETAWDIEYGASGFTQGAGTMVTGTSSNPHSLSGLSANTTYDFYVRSDCGATDGSSNWVGPYTFTTSCGINSVPYFEGFESGYTNQTTVGTCLSQESVSGTQTWTANSSLTSYNRTPNTGSWNAYLRYSNTDWMFIPMSLTGGVSYTTELYARQDYSSTSYANITISYGTGNTAADMTNSIVAATGITNGSYQKVSGTFTPTTSGTYYVGIKGYVSGSPYYMSMDDISIYETPCPVTTVTGAVAHNAGTVTADMECTGSDGWTHYWNSTSNKLVLSLKKNGNSIGTIGDGTFTVSITDNGSASFYTDGTGFINTGVGGVLMDRKWDVTATTQPTTNVDVRFYYTAQNYTDVNTEITAQGGTALIAHTQINFFKVTSGEDPFVVANLSTSDVIIITNGTSASTTKWVAGTFNSDYYAEYQVTSFSGGGGGGASGGVSLPVELTAFSAQADGEVNHLEWTTASEKNNAYFDIERSTNGMDFETIGQVEGNGTTTTVSNYSFTDEMPATVTYYRLRQVDNDHNFNYSHTIVVERNQVGNDKLSLYPVPVTDYLTVEYNTALEEEMTISIIDNNGRLVIQKVIITGQGENQFLINCSNLPAGSYFVRLESATKNISHIIIKQ